PVGPGADRRPSVLHFPGGARGALGLDQHDPRTAGSPPSPVENVLPNGEDCWSRPGNSLYCVAATGRTADDPVSGRPVGHVALLRYLEGAAGTRLRAADQHRRRAGGHLEELEGRMIWPR